MYSDEDPRHLLRESTGKAFGDPTHRPVCFHVDEINEDARTPAGSRTWVVRGEQICIGYSRLAAHDTLAVAGATAEYIIVTTDPGSHLHVSAGDDGIDVRGSAVLIVPDGASRVTSINGGDLIRIFDARTREIEEVARNRNDYLMPPTPTHAVVEGPASDAGSTSRPAPISYVRAYALDELTPVDGRFGRIFRSETLMVNVMFPHFGPRDPGMMSPHSHSDFDQCSITVRGDHVHHLRTPWTPTKADWRADEHLLCHSPAITVIPRGIVHTTEQVGEHEHLMIDAFAPPRTDFLAMTGWVLNAGDYEETQV